MARIGDPNLLFSIEVRGKNHLRLWVEPECLDLLVPSGTLIEIKRREPDSTPPAAWIDETELPEPHLILFPEWGNDLLINGRNVYECWEEYARS